MFNWKSRSRRNYAKTVLKEYYRQSQISDEIVGKMALNMGATTDALIEAGVLKLEKNIQPTKSLLNALDKISYWSIESKAEEAAQLCIRFSKGMKSIGTPEQIPSLLFAAYFKIVADSGNSLRNGGGVQRKQDQIELSLQIRECLRSLFEDFFYRYGDLNLVDR